MHLEEWATHVERLTPGTPERARWIEEQLRNGYAVHNHVWIPADVLRLIDWINSHTSATYGVRKFLNTSPLTSEFILLLQRGAHSRARRYFWLWLTDPFLSLFAILKRARNADRRRPAG